ncbi:MAG: hypothetical protein DYG93_09840 [Leptolyngbya sp. PLA2]|nr:hypothetical protein [Leptolyngbya sp.]MCE7971945.1 hypothetical protein [Leptolyngbya sp. PL-A2]MCQ3939691.1 hypothetical protein [cyanobacterium CYA1]MCZ7632062.1 hypothetical protein [Phycisphaerales bacterium]MDL1903948.1 hypothetical protein [Synechococcales cyanobacterium CNB]GIK18711.1 MAG: hypothetical protein BroJett004_08750 [Planctomycetota bacterium]
MAATAFVRVVSAGAMIALAGLGSVLGYRFLRSQAEAAVYRDRLATLAEEYEGLRATYNEAVRRTAVTELVVRDGRLSVRVRTADGAIRETPTPYDPRGEVYVDYVVRDGRLWIRRVFDASTPPSRAVVIDPAFGEVAWGDGEVGKAVYRSLGEGRWVVSVTGGGSLGLVRAGDADEVELSSAPAVRDYEPALREADAAARAIGLREVLSSAIGR